MPNRQNERPLPGKPESIWLATSALPHHEILSESLSVDVAIVGGGIVGVVTAYLLSGTGLSVALFEAGALLSAVTGNTTAKLTSQHDLRYADIFKRVGASQAETYARSNQWALEWAEDIVRKLHIDCHWARESAHVYTMDPKRREEFEAELDTCVKIGLPAELITPTTLPFSPACTLRFLDQARFHPIIFLGELVDEMESHGVRIFEHTRVTEVQPDEPHTTLKTAQGEVTATHVVIATHYPILDQAFFIAKLYPYMSYAVAYDVADPLPTGMYISVDDDERSLRRESYEGSDVLIVGGGNHHVGEDVDTREFFWQIDDFAQNHYPSAQPLFRWGTQDNETPDRLPYIGRCPGKGSLFVGTGFDGWGMTNGIVAGKLISDLIQGKENDWEETYKPTRMEFRAVGPMVSHNAQVAKEMIGGKFRRAHDSAAELLKRGEADVIQLDRDRIAAFRDSAGVLHAVNAACSHMGCQVRWNCAMKTWDCPCHGSRFTPDGEVIQGPAVTPLKKAILSYP